MYDFLSNFGPINVSLYFPAQLRQHSKSYLTWLNISNVQWCQSRVCMSLQKCDLMGLLWAARCTGSMIGPMWSFLQFSMFLKPHRLAILTTEGFFYILNEICSNVYVHGGKVMQLHTILHHTSKQKTQRRTLVGLESPLWQQNDLHFSKPLQGLCWFFFIYLFFCCLSFRYIR